MTGQGQGRNQQPGRGPVGPVDGTTRLRRSGGPMDRGTFTDRIMARVAAEPTPSPGRVFVRSVRHLALRDALAAFTAAWRLAFEPAAQVSTSARASAAALFLSVVIIIGVGGAFVTGGALSLLGPDGAGPQDLGPGAAPTASPAATIEPTPTPTPTPAPTPTPTPSPSATASPPPTPRAAPPAAAPSQDDVEDRTERKTPKPSERQQDTKKRETPEPKERERDEADEREGDD